MLISDHLAEHHLPTKEVCFNNLKQGMRVVQYSFTLKWHSIEYLTNF